MPGFRNPKEIYVEKKFLNNVEAQSNTPNELLLYPSKFMHFFIDKSKLPTKNVQKNLKKIFHLPLFFLPREKVCCQKAHTFILNSSSDLASIMFAKNRTLIICYIFTMPYSAYNVCKMVVS